MRETIRVLLVDDNKLTCTAVRAVLLGAVDILLLDEIATPTALHQLCTQYKPDILLLSLEMVRKFPLATETICSEAKILLLVTNCTGTFRSELVGDSILGCLVREQIPDELIPAIRGTMAGIRCYSQSVAQLLSQLPHESASGGIENLTPREKIVLGLLTNGLTNKQIDLQLQIASSTVEFHIGNIFKKIGVGSRTEAAIWTKTNHLI
ncbi:MAG: response regulator transcription factor [Anaerolineaceae bacterium]|nr:response regulator transcription factor [Anaerolineaceae bacterium]